jgi:MFS family permease
VAQARRAAGSPPRPVRTNIPFRLDRLPWSRWHWTVVGALGITWILDGLEVTIVGAIAPRLQERIGLGLTATEVGAAGSAYLIGAVIGALVFGELTDRLGRKRLFLVTLAWYGTFTALTAFSWNFWSFALFRGLCGMGIGGEYAAINSTIDELIPARRRGWVDLTVNGTWWLGTILGSALSLVLLNPGLIDQRYGWRLAFALGALLALAVLFVRRSLPESPRWLLTHGRAGEAERVTRRIEQTVRESTRAPFPRPQRTLTFAPHAGAGPSAVVRTLFVTYPKRTLLSLVLMITQAFLYNAIFFTETLVLSTFFGVPAARAGLYIFPFAVGNVLGPLLLGHWFDALGRRRMIAATYAIASLLLFVTAELFVHGALDATTITLCWSVIFFFASAGASAAYLTVSEIFPIELRAQAIAVVYALGTLAGGVVAPLLFGALIQTRAPSAVFVGYAIGAGAMFAGALTEVLIGVDAERKMLEDVARPLSAIDG